MKTMNIKDNALLEQSDGAAYHAQEMEYHIWEMHKAMNEFDHHFKKFQQHKREELESYGFKIWDKIATQGENV